MARTTRRTCGALVLAHLALACGGGNTYAPPPAPKVTVATPVRREVTTWAEFSGHTEAVESVELRARVQGILASIHFGPGSEVREGDLLFVIEPALYEARVAQAEADLAGKEAQASAAEAQLEITRTIFERKAGSRTDLVQKTEARDQAKAAMLQARANLAEAELDLAYTHVHAPIAGRIDRNLVDVGNLVGAGQATLLATLVRDDPIYAYFDVSEQGMLAYRELQRRGETVAPAGQHNRAFLALANERGFPHEGAVDFVSNRLDPSTGTIQVRAVFPNPDHKLVPGLFVRVRLPRTRGPALLVPDVAIGTDLGGKYVLAVDDEQVVQYRRVEIGALVGEERVVERGLDDGERVIVNGLQRARPGATVTPTTAADPEA